MIFLGVRGSEIIHAQQGGNAAALYPGALRGLGDVNGRYLNQSVDSRDVMAEILTRHRGAMHLGAVAPGHSPQPVGFLA